ncbi:MAG: AraC family transcriptional regulator [Colwellia sp.]
MVNLIRAAALNNFYEVVEEFGGDPIRLLNRVGLSASLLKNPDMLFQYSDFVALLNLASFSLKHEDFGLHLGSKQGIEIFGSMGYLLKNCKTVGDALVNFRRFFHIHHASADIGLAIENKEVTLSFAINIKLHDSTAQAVDLALSMGVNMLKTLSSSKVLFSSMHVQHAELSTKRNYRDHLGMLPKFNSTFNGLVFDAEILNLPISAADPTLLAILTSQLDNSNIGYIDEIPKFVESIIQQNIARELISIKEVAHLMALSVRNLQRYLKKESTSFRKIVDNVRNKLAIQYLIDSTLNLNHISDVLAFSNYSEFSRSFKRWNKVTPKEYRNFHSPRKRFTRLKDM